MRRWRQGGHGITSKPGESGDPPVLNALHGLLGFPIVRLVSGEIVPFSSGLVVLPLPKESPSPLGTARNV